MGLYDRKRMIDHHFDISLPIAQIGTYADETMEKLLRLSGVKQCFTFGHVADGNIHFIVDRNSDDLDLKEAINNTVYEPLKDLGGSVSAEHGIGLDKKAYLRHSRSEEEIALMNTLKDALDPRHILNRGRVL